MEKRVRTCMSVHGHVATGGHGMIALPSYDGSEQGFLASYFARHRVRWSELPRRYNLFSCVQADEVRASYAWHLNPAFDGAFHDPLVREVQRALDARVQALLRG